MKYLPDLAHRIYIHAFLPAIFPEDDISVNAFEIIYNMALIQHYQGNCDEYELF